MFKITQIKKTATYITIAHQIHKLTLHVLCHLKLKWNFSSMYRSLIGEASLERYSNTIILKV